jgi:hypothetical protein
MKLQYLNESHPSSFIEEFLDISFARFEAVRIMSANNVVQYGFKLSRKLKMGSGSATNY